MKRTLLFAAAGVVLLVGASMAVAQTGSADDTALGRVGSDITDALDGDRTDSSTVTKDTSSSDDASSFDDGDDPSFDDDFFGDADSLEEDHGFTQRGERGFAGGDDHSMLEDDDHDFGGGRPGLDDETHQALDDAWADGVLTEDEVATLGDLGPMSELVDPSGPLAEYWADGQLTADELAEAADSGLYRFGGGGRGHHDHDLDGDFSDGGTDGVPRSSGDVTTTFDTGTA